MGMFPVASTPTAHCAKLCAANFSSLLTCLKRHSRLSILSRIEIIIFSISHSTIADRSLIALQTTKLSPSKIKRGKLRKEASCTAKSAALASPLKGSTWRQSLRSSKEKLTIHISAHSCRHRAISPDSHIKIYFPQPIRGEDHLLVEVEGDIDCHVADCSK